MRKVILGHGVFALSCGWQNGVVLMLMLLVASTAGAFPLVVRDDRGKEVRIVRPPERIVSLVPSLTEVIFEIDAGERVAGVTFHDLYPNGAILKPVVGGFFSPSTEKISALSPDLLIVADLHQDQIALWEKICPVIQWNSGSIERAYEIMEILGEICGRSHEALMLIEENKKEMARIAGKLRSIPLSKRKRVARIMGRDKMMTPGDDSFQNELIRAAGGIPPKTGKKGAIVLFDREGWRRFNPQMVYGCGEDRRIETTLLSQPGWKEVTAVKNQAIRYYPCELTCRASGRMGNFVSTLAVDLYPDLFKGASDRKNTKQVVAEKRLTVTLPYIKEVSVQETMIFDFIHKSLVIAFERPLETVSTLEGFRKGILSAGNHYFPPQTWALGHGEGVSGLKKRAFQALGMDGGSASFLFTGADMDHLAIREKRFGNLKVYALVTAGVRGNAFRTSKDTGNHVEPGTINIILLTSRCLSRGAMSRAIITATEAKTAALADLDIRSTYSPLFNQATGTGTDNILVVNGEGAPLENTGGHAKMGELIGKAVFEAVTEAIFKQNGIVKGRHVYHRMMERNITFASLLKNSSCECDIKEASLQTELEHLILEPRYAAFIEGAFALSDAYENGSIRDIGFFNTLALSMASEIAGGPLKELSPVCRGEGLPTVLEIAFNALIHGAMERVPR